MKKDYYNTDIFTKDQALEVLSQSDCITIVNANKDFFYDLGELEGKLCKKYPDGTITKGYFFIVSTNNPTFVTVKSSIAAEEEAVLDLALKSKIKAKVQYSHIPLHIKEALLQDISVLSTANIH